MNKFEINGLNLSYGNFQALKNINLTIKEKEITALIGPSGCGKSTLLKCLNRMNDLVYNCKIEGEILLDGADIYSKATDVNQLRKNVGMVFQKANPFPMSVYDNIAFGPRTHGIKKKQELDEIASSIYAQNIDKEFSVNDLEENFTEIVGSKVKWYDSKIDDGADGETNKYVMADFFKGKYKGFTLYVCVSYGDGDLLIGDIEVTWM